MAGIQRFDSNLSELIDRRVPAEPGRLRTLTVLVTGLGSPRVAYSVALVGGALQAHRRGDPVVPQAARSVASVGSGALVRHVLCGCIGRGRPPAERWRVIPDGPSFPSKHTTLATLTCVVLAQQTSRPETRLALAAVATAVGVSRVSLGVHWPSDVLAGWLFGLTWPRLTRVTLGSFPTDDHAVVR